MSAGWLAARAGSRRAVIAGVAAAAVAVCGLVAAGPARAASYPTASIYYIPADNASVDELLIPAGTTAVEDAGDVSFAKQIAVEPATPPAAPKSGCKATVTASKVVTVNPGTDKGPVTARLSCGRISRAAVWLFADISKNVVLLAGAGAANGTAKTTRSLRVTIKLNPLGQALARARGGVKLTMVAAVTPRGSSTALYGASTAWFVIRKART